VKRCTKGTSCGATCIDSRERCVLELGPLVSTPLTKVKTIIKKKEPGIATIFNRAIEAGKAERAPSVPSDLKRQLAALGPPPQNKNKPDSLWGDWETKELEKMQRFFQNKESGPKQKDQLERINRELARRQQPSDAGQPAKKGDLTLAMDDISRIMRGSLPQNLQVASAGNEGGIRARLKTSGGGSATGNTRWARDDASDFDKSFKIYKRIRGDADMVDWNETVKNGKKIGEGGFGTVLKVGNVAHKRGEVGGQEADIIKRVGEAGIGPKLLGAEISTKKRDGYGVDLHNGRIAMSVVPGKELGNVKADTKIAGKNAADIYWKAMADLHRLGIAHNDAHTDNILVDNKGKGRWVDMGLAQASPKAALAEALGVFKTIPGQEASRAPGAAGQGNWQARRWRGTGVSAAEAAKRKGVDSWKEFMERFPTAARVWENRPAAQFKLRKLGLSQADLSSIIDHGIRSPLDSYNKGVWAKITDKQAQEVLNTLYDGI